jgi:outer membrane lipoprotein-sorting protein
MSTAQLKTATPEELIGWVNANAEKLLSLSATVDIATTVGGVKKGKVTEYQEVRGYVLLRKPNMLRMIGLFPIVRNKAFDMVSDGDMFKLWIPPTGKFYVGHNDAPPISKNPLENLRPEVLYNALLIQAINPNDEIAVMEQGMETVVDAKTKKNVEQPDYIIDVVKRGPKGWYLSRKIYFSRTDLLSHRQKLYDPNGTLATDVRYENYAENNGVMFPNLVTINRPEEEYEITIGTVKLQVNAPLTDEQFALNQPPGSTFVSLDNKKNGANGAKQTAGTSRK